MATLREIEQRWVADFPYCSPSSDAGDTIDQYEKQADDTACSLKSVKNIEKITKVRHPSSHYGIASLLIRNTSSLSR